VALNLEKMRNTVAHDAEMKRIFITVLYSDTKEKKRSR
jgi:hypothetical protein